MIKLSFKNIKFLKFVNRIPIIKHFFILKISKSFTEIKDNKVLEKFYKDIYVQSRTSKKTEDNRFKNLENLTLKYLKENKYNYIHDIAVSSGITSNNLYDFLEKKFVNFNMDISDKYSKVYVKQGITTKIFDEDKNLVFAYFLCFFGGDKNIFFPFTVLLYKIINIFLSKFQYDYIQYLFHPEILKKVSRKEIKISEYDIFTTQISEKYTFVRAMNILNIGYFPEEKLLLAVNNIKNSLQEGGVFLVGRTSADNENNVSFFKKINNKLIHLEGFNKGSEIKKLILK